MTSQPVLMPSSPKEEKTNSQVIDEIKRQGYNTPGFDSGGEQYRKMWALIEDENLNVRFESAKNLNLIVVDHDFINDLQNRDGIDEEIIADIAVKYEERGKRLLWCGWVWEYTNPKTGEIMHFIISGYHRNVFCKRKKIEFHFLVVDCEKLAAITLAGMSNAEDTSQVKASDEQVKEKQGDALAREIMTEKRFTSPLSSQQRDEVEEELKKIMLKTYEEYKVAARTKRFSKIIRVVMDKVSCMEDKKALTKKFSDKETQLKDVQTFWKEEFSGETFSPGRLEDSILQTYSDSQMVNYKRKVLISMAMNPEYDDAFDNPGSADIHLAIAIDAEQETMTKDTIKKKEEEWLKELADLNTNPRSNKRMGIPIHRRVVFVSVFEGQEAKVYEWTSKNKYSLV